MPPIRRRGVNARFNPDHLGLNDKLALILGPRERGPETLNSKAAMRALWDDPVARDFLCEMETFDQAPAERSGLGHAPGRRCWPEWAFELLPHEPRRLMDHEGADDLALGTKPPAVAHGLPWLSTDSFESSYRYLARRGLLKADELAEIKRRYWRAFESLVDDWSRDCAVSPVSLGRPWELCDAQSIYGPNAIPAELRSIADQWRTKHSSR